MKLKKIVTLGCLIGIMYSLSSCGSKEKKDYWSDDPFGEKEQKETSKPRYIWIDAAANFPYFANDKDQIRRDLEHVKSVGFTDIVVDVRPVTGDVLFKTQQVAAVQELYAWVNGVYQPIRRTQTWDYLQAFIDIGHELKLKVHAGFNTFVGANVAGNGTGLLYRDKTKQDWASQVYQGGRIQSVMETNQPTKFLNPSNVEVQNFLLALLEDLSKYDLDGIILDRARYSNLNADCSEASIRAFEAYIGKNISQFETDVMEPLLKHKPTEYSNLEKSWLEFRARTIYSFMEKAKSVVKKNNHEIKFGVYVGAWYSSYFDVGVNWASKRYNPSVDYAWASANYYKYGYADMMDQMILGAYASPRNILGAGEWSVQGFSRLAYKKIKKASPIVVAGPDVGNWDPKNEVPLEAENQAIIDAVPAVMGECDGFFLFDLCHIRANNQWQVLERALKPFNHTEK